MSRLFIFSLAITFALLTSGAAGAHAEGHDNAALADAAAPREKAASVAVPAAIAAQPAVWHPGPVTQLSMASKLSDNLTADNAIAVGISQQLNDRVMVRGVLSHGVEKDVTVLAGSLILRW